MRRALLVVLAAGCAGTPASEPPGIVEQVDGALARAGGYLAREQAADGAFRSHTYAALKDGWSVSPLATLALRMTPPDPRTRGSYLHAVAFVATIVRPDRSVRTDEVSYPEYAYALAALVLGAPDNLPRYRPARDALLAAIRTRAHRAGAWGYDAGDRNLSATLFAVGALALAGTPPADPALVAARRFVEGCQNADGGFVFSPEVPDGNKAGPRAGGGFRSYGSMTADGVRLLLRLGRAADDPRVMAGVHWLEAHFDADANPGEFEPVSRVRQDSSYYYWSWSAAHALEHTAPRVFGGPHGDVAWAEALAAALLRRQAADGSWRNAATEMREDDPLVATPFAIAALAICRGVITGQRANHAAWN